MSVGGYEHLEQGMLHRCKMYLLARLRHELIVMVYYASIRQTLHYQLWPIPPDVSQTAQ